MDSLTGVSLPLTQQWMSYVGFDGRSSLNGSKQASGAYIFRPASATPTTIIPGAATVITVTGPIVNESQHTYGYVSQSTRLWAGASNAEIEWTVGPVGALFYMNTDSLPRHYLYTVSFERIYASAVAYYSSLDNLFLPDLATVYACAPPDILVML